MTFKSHPMDKRLREPHPRRRSSSRLGRVVAQAFRDLSKAIEPFVVDMVRPLRDFAATFEGHPRGFRQVDYVKAR